VRKVSNELSTEFISAENQSTIDRDIDKQLISAAEQNKIVGQDKSRKTNRNK